jgi:hypothetical protein
MQVCWLLNKFQDLISSSLAMIMQAGILKRQTFMAILYLLLVRSQEPKPLQ